MFTRIAKFSVFLLPLILLVLVSLHIWTNTETTALLTSFATLLTAMATFIFGIYQVSKDERKIEFHFRVIDESSSQGESDTETLLMATNVGEKPIYISNFDYPLKIKSLVTVYFISEEKNTYIQRSLNLLCSSWFVDALQPKNDNIFCLQAEEPYTGEHPNNNIFELKAGRHLRFFIQKDKEGWLNFLRKGKNFYIYDTAEKRYYIPKWQMQKVKKDLGL